MACEETFEWKVLNAAVHLDKNSIIDALATHGHLIDTPNPSMRTPMHLAAIVGNVHSIEALVRLGSQAIDAPDNDGWTPLHLAVLYRHVPVIEALVRLGSNAIDTPNKEKVTPLHTAIRRPCVQTTRTLLRLGSKNLDTLDLNPTIPFYSGLDCGKLLRALSGSPTGPFNTYDRGTYHTCRLTEEEVENLRFEMYFGHSLVRRLLDHTRTSFEKPPTTNPDQCFRTALESDTEPSTKHDKCVIS